MSVKFLCPQFWGRKWLREFYGRLEKKRPFCRKSHVHKSPRFRGGGILGFLGGGEVPIYFYGREDFSEKVTHLRWRSRICDFLRFSAKIFGFLRKSAVFCGFLRPPDAWIGILPEMEKKKTEIEMENGPKLDRGKMAKKWPKNGKILWKTPSKISISIFFPFPAFGHLPCHTSPAGSQCLNFQEKGWICKNLRFSAKICVLGALCHLRSVTLRAPWGKKQEMISA